MAMFKHRFRCILNFEERTLRSKCIFDPVLGSKDKWEVEGTYVPATLEENSTTCTLRLQGEMDIADALDLKCQLLVALDAKKDILVELAGVTGLNLTTMQLLWAAVTEASATGSTIRFEDSTSETVAAALSQAGLDSLPRRQA